MKLPLVVGVDGSEPSLRAVDWAADEAALRQVSLRVVYASLWERYEGAALARELGKPDGQVRAEDVVEAAARRARARHPDLPISRAALPEEPEYALVREGKNASALVVGTRGRSGVANLLLGSVSLFVAAHADCPVIVIRGNNDNQARTAVHGRVVVGVGDEFAGAVRFAAQEAERRGAVLEAVRAWRCPAHESVDHPLITGEPEHVHEERAAQALEAALRDVPPQVKVERRAVEGPARRVLLAAAHEADLLVVGARRRPGHFGLQLGRTAHTVLHHAACPIAVVPERA
ncbi:universal stress protein [Streptomyces sp. NTH33]|uniref:universal stress protein n=1 Tax=Streptomyces sp. NTH33 TaxID=1735453 RepID=UPI000DA93D23|nr:universal stress protein [Streptomyces sp. NTH33]PZG95258.1 universal stress protein [Streptomyces sp. NTH33]